MELNYTIILGTLTTLFGLLSLILMVVAAHHVRNNQRMLLRHREEMEGLQEVVDRLRGLEDRLSDVSAELQRPLVPEPGYHTIAPLAKQYAYGVRDVVAYLKGEKDGFFLQPSERARHHYESAMRAHTKNRSSPK